MLCVDMDPQANMTVGLGVALSDVQASMADVLSEDRVSLDDIVRETESPGLSIAPATLELASTEVELFTAIGREMVLRDALSGWVENQFDVVIIDCPPTLGPADDQCAGGELARHHSGADPVLRDQGPDRADQGDQHDQAEAEPRPRGPRPAPHLLRRPDGPRPRDAGQPSRPGRSPRLQHHDQEHGEVRRGSPDGTPDHRLCRAAPRPRGRSASWPRR